MRSKLIIPLLLVVALSGCTSQTVGTDFTMISEGKGLPGALRPNQGESDSSPKVYWTDGDRDTITLVTYGSGSCPVKPDGIVVDSAAKVYLDLVDYPGACTADLTAYTSVFKAPTVLRKNQDVTVVLKANLVDQTDTSLTLKADPTLADL